MDLTESLQTGLLLFAVGMITVFTILGGVVICGQILIRIVNKFAQSVTDQPYGQNLKQSLSPNKKQIAAISAAVEQVSIGKGRIEKIEKI